MKPFLHGKKSLETAALRAPGAMPALRRVPAPPAPAEHGGQQVEVIKEGDKVVRLIVTCSCGERTEVDCIYSGH
jgi:hypothetical protein